MGRSLPSSSTSWDIHLIPQSTTSESSARISLPPSAIRVGTSSHLVDLVSVPWVGLGLPARCRARGRLGLSPLLTQRSFPSFVFVFSPLCSQPPVLCPLPAPKTLMHLDSHRISCSVEQRSGRGWPFPSFFVLVQCSSLISLLS